MSKRVDKFPMTTDEQKICLALGGVRYLPGTFDKRFGMNLYYEARNTQHISEKQREWCFRLLYKYRRQIPHLYSLHQNHPYCQKINP